MKDVYITDHVYKPKKLNTLSEEEDQHFYEYAQSIEEYQQVESALSSQFESGKYPRGSLAQRIFEPLAGAKRDSNGTLVYELCEKDVAEAMDEQSLVTQF